MPLLRDEPLHDCFRRPQIMDILRLDFRQHQLPLHVVRKTHEFVPYVRLCTGKISTLPLRPGGGIEGLWLILFIPPVVKRAERLREHHGDVMPPDDSHHETNDRRLNDASELRRSTPARDIRHDVTHQIAENDRTENPL